MLNAFFGNVIFPFYLHVTPACNMQSHVLFGKKNHIQSRKRITSLKVEDTTKKLLWIL